MRILIAAFITCLTLPFSNTETLNQPEQEANISGAWRMISEDGVEAPQTSILLLMDGYLFITDYSMDKKHFEGSIGAVYQQQGDEVNYDIEFSTYDTDMVGDKVNTKVRIEGNQMFWKQNFNGKDSDFVFERVDNGVGDLAGAWRITDRMRNGQMTAMRQGSRKTIKMITGTRFQWAAYDPATKRFSGTGGGTIELKDGEYTENIEFFSRNKDRVGVRLTFDYKVDGNKWDHSGMSSSGNPIREIWTRQNQ